MHAVDLEGELFGAREVGLRAHHAVERDDAVADERAQVADAELLVEALLDLERELRVAGVDVLARRRCGIGGW